MRFADDIFQEVTKPAFPIQGHLNRAKTNAEQARIASLGGKEMSVRKRKEQDPVSGLTNAIQSAQ